MAPETKTSHGSQAEPPPHRAAGVAADPTSSRRGRSDSRRAPPANTAALDRAFARAVASKIEILNQPDMLNGESFGARVGLSRATVDNRRVAGKLLALDFGSKRGFRYPAWQAELIRDEPGRAAFEAVLRELAAVGPWSRYRFLIQASSVLGGRTPVAALEAGEFEAAQRAAGGWAQGEQGGG